MIFDRISEHKTYEKLHPLYKEAFEFLAKAGTLEPGRYELSEGMYANVAAEASTKPMNEIFFETHNNFIDIQYIVSGESILTWAPADTLEPSIEYNPVKDITKLKGEGTEIKVAAGNFYIVYPNDGHKPNGHKDIPTKFKVVVVKVPVIK